MSEIYFDNITVQYGKVEMHCKSYDDELNIDERLFFHFSEDIYVNHNQIAIALSTLCGSVYDFVYMDLVVNYDIYNKIQNFINCKLDVKQISNDLIEYNLGKNILICFSGGFDSLAAYALLNDDFNIINVSLDFGGAFSREEKFFKRFSPIVIKTNFVDLKLNRNSTSFMYIPAIFFCNYFNAGYGVLADTFESENNLFKRNDGLILSFLEVKNFPLVLGLTEVGTASIVIKQYPDLVDLSLSSLANPGEIKRYRKQLIIKILSKKFNEPLFFDEIHKTPTVMWGDYLYFDFICLYFVKHVGVEVTSKIIKDIPDEAINFANSLSLNFYEKVNVDFLEGFSNNDKSIILQKLFEFNIYPYNSEDYTELNEVMEFLSNYHYEFKSI